MIFLISGNSHSSSSKKKKLLLVHSWHDVMWVRIWEDGLRKELKDQYELKKIYLDCLRLSPEEFNKKADEAWSFYRKWKPDGVIIGDDYALKLLGPRLETVKTPVVFIGVNNNPRKFISMKKKHITGVLERPNYRRMFHNLINHVFPKKTKKVLFLSEVSPLGTEELYATDTRQIFVGNLHYEYKGVRFEMVIKKKWSEWKDQILNAKKRGYDILMYDSRYFLKDEKGKYIEPEAALMKYINDHSPIPAFGPHNDSIGPQLGAGGWVLSAMKIGQLGGKIVNDIFQNGKDVRTIRPIYFEDHEYIFSRGQLKKWNIKLSKEILNKVSYVEDMYDFYKFDWVNL